MRLLFVFLPFLFNLLGCYNSNDTNKLGKIQQASLAEVNSKIAKENSASNEKNTSLEKSKKIPSSPPKSKKKQIVHKKKPKAKLTSSTKLDTIDITTPFEEEEYDNPYIPNKIPEASFPRIFNRNPQFMADGYDFPIGKPNAEGYYKSLNFGDRLHLGEDWNGKGGGNTDLGDPVYTTASGLVTFAEDVCCGWGNTIRIVHRNSDNPNQPFVESLYSHLHTMHVKVGDLIHRGQQIGTIGTARGQYIAHLHFEMRDFINMSIGPGYSDDQMGYLSPTPFIKANRPK